MRNHEEELRGREKQRYAKGKPDGLFWYGAARPQNLEYFFRPKLVLQVLSRRPSFALDQSAGFMFAAGGTAGVYGITLDASAIPNLSSVAAVLNSRAADFQVEQVSSVFGSRFYSYGDQFIDQIVLPTKSPKFSSTGPIADKLVFLTMSRAQIIRKMAAFTESFGSDLAKYELETVKRLCNRQPQSENLKIIQDAIRVEASLYGFEVHYGTQTPFECEMMEHAECLAEAFRNQKLQNIRRKEVLSWRLPVTASGCKKLLELVAGLQADLSKVRNQVSSTEDKLNDLVFEMYGLSKNEQRVVDGFLERYSSTSKAAAAEELENETAEKIDIVEE